jgi:hypothetical protein
VLFGWALACCAIVWIGVLGTTGDVQEIRVSSPGELRQVDRTGQAGTTWFARLGGASG